MCAIGINGIRSGSEDSSLNILYLCALFLWVINVDNYYMLEALKEAEKGYKQGEVPIGAVVVENGKIIARAHNTKDSEQCAIRHAEINAIEQAALLKKNWRLNDCTIYVTLFPCPMCASAINQSRMKRVVYGTDGDKVDFELVKKILEDKNYGNPVEICGKVLENECSTLLKKFFVEKR